VSRQGGRLSLIGTPERVVELLTMAGLGDVFQRFDTVEAARADLTH
jgi:anti-anti-sigma regulatory factor